MSLGTSLSRSSSLLLNELEISTSNQSKAMISRATTMRTLSELKSQAQAFICHNESHWFTIRKLHGMHLNLNSTCSLFPQVISEFYLSAFLDSIMANGYLIFAVNGEFPHYDPSIFDQSLQSFQRFIPLEQVLENHEKEKTQPGY